MAYCYFVYPAIVQDYGNDINFSIVCIIEGVEKLILHYDYDDLIGSVNKVPVCVVVHWVHHAFIGDSYIILIY